MSLRLKFKSKLSSDDEAKGPIMDTTFLARSAFTTSIQSYSDRALGKEECTDLARAFFGVYRQTINNDFQYSLPDSDFEEHLLLSGLHGGYFYVPSEDDNASDEFTALYNNLSGNGSLAGRIQTNNFIATIDVKPFKLHGRIRLTPYQLDIGQYFFEPNNPDGFHMWPALHKVISRNVITRFMHENPGWFETKMLPDVISEKSLVPQV